MDIVWDDDNFIEVVLLAMQQEDDDSTEESDEGQVKLDEEQEVPPPHQWGSGSRIGKAPNIELCLLFYSHLLFNDFWGDLPGYGPSYFKRFFKLPIGLFDEIVTRVVAHDDYFRQKKDASGKLVGLSSLQKICSALRQLTSSVLPIEHNDK